MRSQLMRLIHLMVILCIVFSLTAGFASAIENNDERSREFKRLFGETSDPLGPEEARRLIAHQWAVYRKHGEPTDLAEREEFQAQASLLVNLINIEAFSGDCNGNMFWSVDLVASRIDRHPALKNYFNDLRDRLLESCNKLIADKLNEYQSRAISSTKDKTLKSMVRFAYKSLSQVPARVVLGENWLKRRNDQVSAALYAVMRERQSCCLKRFIGTGDFRDKFDSTVGSVCQSLPKWPVIIPTHMESYFVREDKLDQLDRAAMNWHKLNRVCELIRMHPDLASDIVFDYKNAQKMESQAEREQHGCF